MTFNEKKLDTWVKVDLQNGKYLYIKEHKEQELKEKEPPVKSGVITIHKKRVLGKTSFILTDSQNDFEGFMEFDLLDDRARLVERKLDTDLDIEAHEVLKEYIGHLRANPGLALFTNNEKRGKGIGKELLYYGFLYLKTKGIDIMEIGSASNKRTKKFYRDNGAIMNDSGFPKEFNNFDERIEELKRKLGINNQIPIRFSENDEMDR